jgi:MFS family permease
MEEERRERREEGEVEVGRKGGAAAMAGVPAAERAAAAFWTRDLVRWGPIWAGLLLALGIQLVLGTIGLAIALSAYDPAAPDFAERAGTTLSIWNAVTALIALFIGGYIAGRMAAVLGLRNGLVQGSVVWALALVIGMLLSALGVAGFLGAVDLRGLVPTMTGISAAEARDVAASTARGAWWFVVGAILAWIAAAGGGVLGTSAHRERIEEEIT